MHIFKYPKVFLRIFVLSVKRLGRRYAAFDICHKKKGQNAFSPMQNPYVRANIKQRVKIRTRFMLCERKSTVSR